VTREIGNVQADDTAGTLFRAGRLGEAIAAASARLRKEPNSLAGRLMLAELLVFAGNLERADSQMVTAAAIDPSIAIVAAEFRQLLRAEQARAGLLEQGRVPEFLSEGPTAAQRAALACVVAMRDGDMASAVRHAATAEEIRPRTGFVIGDNRVEDFRDADDVICASLEVLTPTGKYLWIPFERIARLAFHPPQRPRDLIWRRATLEVAAGPAGEVYVPVLYAGASAEADDALKLGRAIDWRELADGLTRGAGQRMFVSGEDGMPIMQLPPMVREG
jgi:type VI secretion system protein ImpE